MSQKEEEGYRLDPDGVGSRGEGYSQDPVGSLGPEAGYNQDPFGVRPMGRRGQNHFQGQNKN